jgi:pimeloyl-ACP methyl ester carboxylesterase
MLLTILLFSSLAIVDMPSRILPLAPWFSTTLRTRYCMHSWILPQVKHLYTLGTLLGFKSYVVQGGDVGGRVARIMAAEYPNCKAIHLNTSPMLAPDPSEIKSPLDNVEKEGLARHKSFTQNGSAYAWEQAIRPNTIDFVLRLLTFNSPFYPNSFSQPNYKTS